MSSVTQPTFAGGVIAQSVQGRVDLDLYENSLAKGINFIVQRTGGITNRPGLEFVGQVINGALKYRLIPFSFNTEQNYVLELGELTMRVIKDGAYVLDGAGAPVQFPTPWYVVDLFRLKITQSADIMWVTHPSYPTQRISRSSHTSWSIQDYGFGPPPFQSANGDKASTVFASAAAGTITLTAAEVVFLPQDVGSWFSLECPDYGDYIPWAADTVFTVGDYTYSDQKIYRAVAKHTENSAFTKFKSGPSQPMHTEGSVWDGRGMYDAGDNAVSYNIGFRWQYVCKGYGLARITAVASDGKSATAEVVEEFPSAVIGLGNSSYKWAISAFGQASGFPAAVAFYQQRLCFANTYAQPQTLWMSKTNVYNDHGNSRPTEDDDAVSFTIGSRQVNEIRHIVPLQVLLLLTSGGEFKVSGGDGGVITPASPVIDQQGARGSSHVSPLVIGSTALYVQEKGSVIRDLGYQYNSDSFTGDDLSVRAAHFFDGYTITDWAYCQVPWSAVFAVRNDGKLLCLTYMREQSVVAWTMLETDGAVESVAVIGEGSEDVLYVSVRRQVGGETVRYVERMHSRWFADRADAFFVDSGLSYDGRSDGTTTVTVTASDYSQGADLTATFSTEFLMPTHVGKVVHVPVPGDTTDEKVMRLKITEVVSESVAVCVAQRDLPSELHGVPTSTWGIGVFTVAGLDHLEGRTVAILADGSVKTPKVVTGGAVSNDYSAVVIHAGLPYKAVAQTLDLYQQLQGESMRSKRRNITKVSLLCESSAGVKCGASEDILVTLKQRDYEFYDQTAGLLTGMIDATFPGRWDQSGRVTIVQDDPLPLTILSVTPEFSLGN